VDYANTIAESVENNNSLANSLVVTSTNGTGTSTNPVVKMVMKDGKMNLTWNSVSGKVYQVGYKNALANNTWTPLGPLITATNSMASYTDNPIPVGVKSRFYNVQMK
jgi:hypothetical protein